MNESNFELENLLMVVTVKTVNTLLSEENGSDALGLYFFYYKTAKKQKTNQVRATDTFCMKGLGFGETRFRNAKAILKKYNLVENIKSSVANGGWYIKINYIHQTTPKNEVIQPIRTTPEIEVLRSEGTNALSKYNINALSKETIVTNVTIEEFGNSSINTGIKLLTSLLGQNPPKLKLNRFALKRLYKTYGEDRTLKAIQFAFQVRDMKYAPQVYSYLDLEEKWARLEGFARRKVASPNILSMEDMR